MQYAKLVLVGVLAVAASCDRAAPRVMDRDRPEGCLLGKGGAASKALADGAPSSPFAADYKAGMLGLMMPLVLMGGLMEELSPVVERYLSRTADPSGRQ